MASLTAEDRLAANRPDQWGTPMDVKCEDDGIRVTSAGPDRRLGTADDVVGDQRSCGPFPSGTAVAVAMADAMAPLDAAIDAADDAADAGALDLLLPPWSDELTTCASEAVRLRLGIRGTFELDVTIGPGDGGRTEALIADDGRVYVAPALTCFDRLARRVATDPRAKGGTFRVTVRGPYPRWILKRHG